MVYFDVLDGCMIFVILRGKVIYIGIIDIIYKGWFDWIVVIKVDVDYFLNVVNNVFFLIDLIIEDLIFNWVGFCLLIYEDGKFFFELFCKDEIFFFLFGLIFIVGGKFMGYCKMV